MTRRAAGWTELMAWTEAGCVYASTVFAIGFALGAIRVLLVVPRVGETYAVLLEAPFMLAASWKMSRLSARRHGVQADTRGALLMGAIAFAVLMFAEWGTSVLVFNRTTLAYFVSFGSAPGAIGLAAQLCFACFPFIQASNNGIASSR